MQSSLGLSNGLCAVRRVVVGECSEVGRGGGGVLVLSQILPKRSFDQFWSWNRHTFLGENTTPFLVSFSESAPGYSYYNKLTGLPLFETYVCTCKVTPGIRDARVSEPA